MSIASHRAAVFGLLAVFAGGLQAAGLDSVEQRYSYTMGLRLGDFLKAQGIDQVDSKAFAAGVADQMAGRDPQLDREAQRQAIVERQAQADAEKEQLARDNIEKGKAFLAENAKRPGVQTLDNGLQYLELKAGDGKVPQASDKVRVHYHGTLISGEVFDSSVQRGEPVEFQLSQVIPGFREAITRMPVGAKWRVFVPSDLAYGEQGAGNDIAPNETLIFEISLLDIL